MNLLMKKFSRITLVVVTTIITLVAALCIVSVAHLLMGEPIQQYQIVITVVATILITSVVSWYLYGLLKKLESLEQELRHSISKEKEAIYIASIQSSQHVINNLLNQLMLVAMEIKKQPTFDDKVAKLFGQMQEEATELMQQLASVKQIEVEDIKRSITPK
ncbi:hypothetical protein A9Q78_06325 [Methylophaga sp. 41_12_T18]|nr:hypothetical protein A9Q78_06325 [Methylophaga sp. 41_12_T18]